MTKTVADTLQYERPTNTIHEATGRKSININYHHSALYTAPRRTRRTKSNFLTVRDGVSCNSQGWIDGHVTWNQPNERAHATDVKQRFKRRHRHDAAIA